MLPPPVPGWMALDLCSEFVVLEDPDERDGLVLGASVSDEGAELIRILVRLGALAVRSEATLLVADWIAAVLEPGPEPSSWLP